MAACGIWCVLVRRALLQHGVSEGELMLPGAGGSHGDADPADAEAHERADFEELQPDGAASRIGELGMGKPYPTQRAEQDIGEGGEPQAHLVGPHGCRGGAVGEQIELAFPRFREGRLLMRFSMSPRAQ